MEIKDVQELLSKASADVQEKIKGLVTEAESLKAEMKKMREEGSSELEAAKKELNEVNKKQGIEIERMKRAEQGTSFKAKLIEQIERNQKRDNLRLLRQRIKAAEESGEQDLLRQLTKECSDGQVPAGGM